MSNNYKLKFTRIANDDLEQIYNYISNNLSAEMAVSNLIEEIECNIMRLADFPLSGSMVLDEVLQAKGYRKLIANNYIVFYLINEEERMVIVMRIIYGGQQYQDII